MEIVIAALSPALYLTALVAMARIAGGRRR